MDLSFRNNRFPKKGSILISDPFLADGYFTRSVVILCDYSNDGSFGLVLTNYLEIDFSTIDASFPIPNAKVSVGGPVDTEHLFYIHQFGSAIEESILIKENLYFGGNYSQLQQLLQLNKENEKKVRFFLGYAGWGATQLVEELKENAWIVVDNISVEEIMNTDEPEFWKYCLEKQGTRFKIISQFPLNPNEN